MKFCVLALDYDGTMAEKGKTHPAVLAALSFLLGAENKPMKKFP